MERPGWWPANLWLSGGADGARVSGGEPRLPERAPTRMASDPGREPPARSFLRTLLAMLGAERASVWIYRRDEGTWNLEREVCSEDGLRPEGGGPVPAEGHPFTWALREGLVLQLPSERLGSMAPGSGWTLLGVVPGSRRALSLQFAASPPAAARRGLEAALCHLADLERAGYLRPT